MKLRWLLLLLFCGLLPGAVPLHAQPLPPKPANLEESLRKARINGKYAMLLAQIAVPGDVAQYGEFNDKGFAATPEWAGFKDLPAGYWVYVSPYWYIWRDVTTARRGWGPEQAVGEPDTAELGDIQTAWASRTSDDQPEWLLAEFASPVSATSVKIYESFNPGAISKITAFGLDGKEVEIWAGQAAPVAAVAVVVNQKEFPRPLKTNRLKIYLDSPRVPGWNEIDAIGLLEGNGKVQWANIIACSSTHAEQNAPQTLVNVWGGGYIPAVPDAQGLQQLQEQLRQMQIDINELRQRAGLPPRPIPVAPPNIDLFFGAENFNWRGVQPGANFHGGYFIEKRAETIPGLPGAPLIIDGVPLEPEAAGPGKVLDKPK